MNSSDTFEPQPAILVAEMIAKADIEGLFDVELTINPDPAFEAQQMATLVEFLGPLLQPIYPTGFRMMVKRWAELQGQKQFDLFYPAWVAELQTERIMLMAMMELQKEMAALQGMQQPPPDQMPPPEPPTPPPPGSDPQTQALQEQALQSQAQADMLGHRHQVLGGYAQMAQKFERLMQMMQKSQEGTRGQSV